MIILMIITNGIYIYILVSFWVDYNDLTATSLEMMASKRNYPNMFLFQVSELLLLFTQIYAIHI